MVRNIHADESATHWNGASLGGKTSLLAREARAEGPQNEKRPFRRLKSPLQAVFEMGSCNSRARTGELRIV